MIRMLDLLRPAARVGRDLSDATSANPDRGRRRRSPRHPALESLEERRLMASLGSFFSGFFPSSTSPTTNVATSKRLHKLLTQPTDVSYPPFTISAQVAPLNDPGGTGVVFSNKVLVEGVAVPYSTVWLAYGPLGYFNDVARAGADGTYLFLATLPVGRTTQLRTFAESPTQSYSAIATVKVTQGNPIVAWDALALAAIRNSGLDSDEASRALAILHTAQYDAIAAATGSTATFEVSTATIPGASATIAADAAAAGVLKTLFPAFGVAFNTALTDGIRGRAMTQSLRDGLALGQEVAAQTLVARGNDNALIASPYGLVVNPNWSQVTPFAITSASAFRPAAPPAPGTTAFDQALAEVTALGRDTSTVRTPDQTRAAEFWDDSFGSLTDPSHWNAIAEELVVNHQTSLAAGAQLFAELDVALADSSIAVADSQATYTSTRPITAIQPTEPLWQPLIITPTAPGYVSDHAAYGAAAANVLGHFFGANVPFTTSTNASTANPTRSFASFAAAGTEDGVSRIYAGDNFRFDVTAGAALGTAVSNADLTRFPKP